MTRQLNEQEVLHDLRTVGKYEDEAASPAPTTLATTVTAGSIATFNLASGTGFANGDVIRLGAQGNNCDIVVIDNITTDTVTPLMPVAFGHSIGAAVTKLNFVNIGAVTEDGIQSSTSQDETPLVAGNQKGTYLFIGSTVEETFSFAALGYNPENLAASVGLDENAAAVVVAAVGVQLNPNNFATLTSQPWLFQGIREDLLTVSHYVANGKVATANQDIQFTTGQAAGVPWTIRSTGHRMITIV